MLDTLIVCIHDKLMNFELDFWKQLSEIGKDVNRDVLLEWFVKLMLFQEKEEKKNIKRKKQKIRKMFQNDDVKMKAEIGRFEEHIGFYHFKSDIMSHEEIISPGIVIIFNLAALGTAESQSANDSVNELSVDITSANLAFCVKYMLRLKKNITSANSENSDVFGNSACEKIDNIFVGKFVSSNVVNLSSKILTKCEISSHKATLKEELEIFGRRLRLLWHLSNEEQTSTFNPFQRKSKFNPKGNFSYRHKNIIFKCN